MLIALNINREYFKLFKTDNLVLNNIKSILSKKDILTTLKGFTMSKSIGKNLSYSLNLKIIPMICKLTSKIILSDKVEEIKKIIRKNNLSFIRQELTILHNKLDLL